jgi:hypothetical protein
MGRERYFALTILLSLPESSKSFRTGGFRSPGARFSRASSADLRTRHIQLSEDKADIDYDAENVIDTREIFCGADPSSLEGI